MKTFEIKMNRSRWTSLIIGVLLVAMIVMMCLPYFTYGSDQLTFTPASTNTTKLYGETWVLSGSDSDTDGYKEIEISKDGKSMTVRTTNIIRVNQLAADEAVETALAVYEEVKANVVACEEALKKAEAELASVQAISDELKAKGGFKDETEADATEAAEGEEEAAATEEATDDPIKTAYDSVASNLKKVTKSYTTCQTNYENAKAALVTAQEAVTAATEAAKKAYTADASYTWITETTEAKDAALKEAYPDKEAADLEAMLGSERDSVINEKLAAYKATAIEAGKEAAAAKKSAETAQTDAAKCKKNVDSAIKTSDKEIDKAVKSIVEIIPEYEAAEIPETFETTAVADVVYTEYEKTSDEPKLMETTGKVTYKNDKETLKLEFANGDTIETTYATKMSYNGKKDISILYFVGFPYNATDFDTELGYKIADYKINDVVLLPIVLLVLAIIGIVLCILKKDKFTAGIIPAAFGIVGVVGYLTSAFLKLGNHYVLHIVVCAVILVVSALHIYLGIKDKKDA